MARIRTLKPDFWTDEKIVGLSMAARLLFIGMWNFVDEAGRCEFSPTRLKLQILPSDPIDILELVGELQTERLIVIYEVEGKQYFQVVNFSKHQKTDPRWPSKLPSPPTHTETHQIPPTPAPGMEREGKGRERSYEPKGSLSEPSSDDQKPKRKKIAYSEDFEAFWKDYPTDQLMSKKQAFDAWKRLSPDDREQAARAVPAFRRYCDQNPDYRPVHACRFLLQRRFDGFSGQNGAANQHTGPPDGMTPEQQAAWVRKQLGWDNDDNRGVLDKGEDIRPSGQVV